MQTYTKQENGDYAWLESPMLSQLGLVHRFLLKPLNFRSDSLNQAVSMLRQTFLADNIPLVMGQQIHSANVRSVAPLLPIAPAITLSETDGLVTSQENVALLAKYADCIPIVLFDPVRRVQAVIHSGWQGTLQKIGLNGLQQMLTTYQCRVEDIRIVMGPAIGFEDFEVTEEVYRRFQQTFAEMPQVFRQKDATHWIIDTKAINRRLFESAGVLPQHIEDIALSTVQTAQCHSYRRDKQAYGLMAVVSYMSPRMV